MKNEEIKEAVTSSFSPKQHHDRLWISVFNELCYEVFYKNEYGRQLLAHLENRFFRSPVASPNREPSWAYFNEGQNEMIRSFTHGIQSHLIEGQVKANAQNNPLPRRAKVKPIPNK